MPQQQLSWTKRRFTTLAIASAVTAAVPVLLGFPTAASAFTPVPPQGQGLSGELSWINRVQWTSQQVSPGVTVRTGVLSDPSADNWTVTVDATTTSSITGNPAKAELGTKSWAESTASQLSADGYTPVVTAVSWPDYADAPRGIEGYRVRTGDFPTSAAASSLATALHGLGFTTASVEWNGYDQDQTPDAELFHEAIINPGSSEIEATHAGAVGQVQDTVEVAAELGATVVTDGGWAGGGHLSYTGVPYSMGAYDGKLESLGNLGRAALIIRNNHAEVAAVDATATVHAGSASYPINGINRWPGYVEGCGRPGSESTTQPRQDIFCTESSELVLDTSELGLPTVSGSGTQAVLDANGTVLSAGAQTGGNVPAGGYIIQGIGDAGTWLTQHAVVGQRLGITEKVTTTTGQNISLSPGVSITSAAPILDKDGQVDIDAVHEGVIDPADLSFNYNWAEQRQPRTIVGIGPSGQLLLVTVDGRQPGVADGATLTEEAALMKSLGAITAMNDDGGGSTAMAVNGTLVNKPSNAGNLERGNADFVVALPKAKG